MSLYNSNLPHPQHVTRKRGNVYIVIHMRDKETMETIEAAFSTLAKAEIFVERCKSRDHTQKYSVFKAALQ